MSRSSTIPLGILFVLVFAGLLWMPGQAMLGAQEPGANQSSDTQNKKATTPKKQKKPKGRLPVFYSKVVSGDQREEIYAIQAKYAPEMDALVEQLVELRNKMQSEIKSVLTPKQVARLKKLRAEAKQRRAERAAARSEDSE